jgi:Cu(I)/Ag(I) efflux system protein CusF
MKAIVLSFAVLSMSLVTTVVSPAESDGTKGMDMKGMDMQGAESGKNAKTKVRKGAGSVTDVDLAGGTVTIVHGPVKTLNWPAMTMGFGVKKKSMLNTIQPGAKVEFSFVQSGKDYVITKIRKK